MSLPLGPWRLTYTPGQWLVLAGRILYVSVPRYVGIRLGSMQRLLA